MRLNGSADVILKTATKFGDGFFITTLHLSPLARIFMRMPFGQEQVKPQVSNATFTPLGQCLNWLLTKKDRKYNEITVEKTLELWPSFYEDLDNRFVFFMLVGD